MNFIRTVCNSQCSSLRIHFGEQLILTHPLSTKDLNSSVEHSSSDLWHDNLSVSNAMSQQSTFAVAICRNAPLAPRRSIMSAAFKTKSLADSISILRAAIWARNKSWSLRFLPNGVLPGSTDLARINDIARSQVPMQRILKN